MPKKKHIELELTQLEYLGYHGQCKIEQNQTFRLKQICQTQ
jgi:hypothetical protein